MGINIFFLKIKKINQSLIKIREAMTNDYNYLKNEEFRKTLSFLDALSIKLWYAIEGPSNYKVFTGIAYLTKQFPKLFNKNYIAKLFILTKGRIHYEFEADYFDEEFLMKLLKKEYFLPKEEKQYYKNYVLDYISIFPEDFKVLKKKNIKKIKKHYIEYIYFLPWPFDIELFKKYFKKGYSLNYQKIDKMKLYNQKKELQFFLINTYPDFLINFLKYSKYSGYDFFKEISSKLYTNFLPINLEESNFYFTEKELLDLYSIYPNLRLQDKSIYLDSNLFGKTLDIIIKEYFTIKKEVIYCKLSDEELDFLSCTIDETAENMKIDFEKLLNISIMKNLILLNPDFFVFSFFKNKYSPSILTYLQSIPKIKCINTSINSMNFEALFKRAIEIDLEENDLTENISNFLYKYNSTFFLQACHKYICHQSLNIEEANNLVLNVPAIINEDNIFNILNIETISSILKEKPYIYKYLNTENKLKLNNLMVFQETNIKYIPIEILKINSFNAELISTNKYLLMTILKRLSTVKNYSFEYLREKILNEFLRSENEEYLLYLDDEAIETLIFLKKLDFNNLKNKKVIKKIRKIYTLIYPDL